MGLGEINWFSFKSKATQQKEQEDYARWAFPYGQKQRDNLEALLREIFPGETVPSMLIPFLTCKELYQGVLQKTGSVDSAIDAMINIQKKYKQILKKRSMTTYLALVLADAVIDERCEYPTLEEIKNWAAELDTRRNS